MKTKKFSKKIILRKETIANLGRKQMSGLQAGLAAGPETWGAAGYDGAGDLCENGTTQLDSNCPIETCTC